MKEVKFGTSAIDLVNALTWQNVVLTLDEKTREKYAEKICEYDAKISALREEIENVYFDMRDLKNKVYTPTFFNALANLLDKCEEGENSVWRIKVAYIKEYAEKNSIVLASEQDCFNLYKSALAEYNANAKEIQLQAQIKTLLANYKADVRFNMLPEETLQALAESTVRNTFVFVEEEEEEKLTSTTFAEIDALKGKDESETEK